MINENLKAVIDRIEKSANKVGKKLQDIKLVAVTKNVAAQQIIELLNLGVNAIGENRIQEAEKKFNELCSNVKFETIEKHFIGHLQTNKVKKAVKMFDLIQSVDSFHLAQEIGRQAKNINKIQYCLVEVKVSEEETKYGCQPENLGELLEKTAQFENIRFLGLMTLAPFFNNPEDTRTYFHSAKELFDKFYSYFLTPNPYTLNPILSMGMSNDFEVAIEEGANMVRIGTAIFG